MLETGIRLHHTYGMPIIPGSALKGLAAHYCDQIWGDRHIETPFKMPTDSEDERREVKHRRQKDRSRRDNYHRLLFGTTDDSGCITFHDAWYIPDSSAQPLVLDVMTPHHPKWLDGSVPPTDFDSPTPVPFLSVIGAVPRGGVVARAGQRQGQELDGVGTVTALRCPQGLGRWR